MALQGVHQAELVRLGLAMVYPEHGKQQIVEAALHLQVGEPQRVESVAQHGLLHVLDGDVAGLEQQSLGGDIVNIEATEQLGFGLQSVQLRSEDPALPENVDEKCWRGALEPVGAKLTLLE